MMQVTYQSSDYSPEQVTGRYVRVAKKWDIRLKLKTPPKPGRPKRMFLVFETATCLLKNSSFYGRPGFGYTIREYLTDGSDLPEELKQRCIESQETKQWD